MQVPGAEHQCPTTERVSDARSAGDLNVTFHTARSTAFPQPAPGTAPSPGPMKVADDKLRSVLGITDVTFKRGQQRLAIIDQPLRR